MKKSIFTLLQLIIFTIAFAQVPNKMSYQAVIRNNQNILVSNQAVGMRVSILQGSATGTAVYVETHTPTTNINGLATIEIGGGTPVTATFATINWANGPYFVKTETDPSGGSNYSITGTSQLLSVPYALFAGNVTNNGGKQTLVLSDDVSNTQAAAIIATEVGPNTQEIKIIGTTQLTQVDLSMIQTAIEISVENNDVLTSINLSGLSRMDGDLTFNNCPLLSTINLSTLEKITTGSFSIRNTALTTINMPQLQKLNGGLSIRENSNLTSISFNLDKLSSLSISTNIVLSSISFNNLSSIRSLSISSNSLISSISFPTLSVSNNISISDNSALNSVTFPALTIGDISIGYNSVLSSASLNSLTNSKSISITENPLLISFSANQLTSLGVIYFYNNSLISNLVFPALTSITNYNNNSTTINIIGNAITTNPFPVLSSFAGASISLNNNKLTSSSVNAFLSRLISISPTLTGKTIFLNSQTPLAPPTGQGLTDKQTLINNGNQVYTD